MFYVGFGVFVLLKFLNKKKFTQSSYGMNKDEILEDWFSEVLLCF